MITQLIAVQSAVPRERLGIATSTAHFFRSIGGAVGVAVMGTVMTQRMNRQHQDIGAGAVDGELPIDGLQDMVQNPNAFLEPAARAALSPEVVAVFQNMLANALYGVFIVGSVVSVLGLISVGLMPGSKLTHTPQ